MSKHRHASRGTKDTNPPDPFKDKVIQVHTIFGVSIIRPLSIVYVKVGAAYVRKRAVELTPGEGVLFAKEGIPDITLEQVEEALRKSTRYVSSLPPLFWDLGDGRTTTFFRGALLRGLIERPGEWPDGILTHPVKVGPGNLPIIEDDSLPIASAHIAERLKIAGVEPLTEAHIQHNWLGGRVIAPLNLENIIPALLSVAPALSEMLSDRFRTAYRHYVAIRRTVMRQVSNLLHTQTNIPLPGEPTNGSEGNGSRPETERVCVTPELKLVAEHFASSITATHLTATVLKVEEKGTASSDQAKHRGTFFKGVETGAVDSTVIQIKPVNLVIAEERTLITLFERLRIDYSAAISATFAASALDPPSELDLVRLVSLTLGYEDIETRRERLVRAQLAIKGISQNVGPADSDTPHYATGGEQMHAIGRAIQDSLGDGILDDILEVDPGMSVRFLDAFFRARHAVPIDYLALCAAKRAMVAKQEQSRLSGQAISDKKERRVYDDLLKGLIRAGYNPDIEERATLFFHTYSLSDYPQIPETLAKRVLFNILNGGFTVEQALTRANLGFRPEIILPDEHDLSILERLGLGQLARHYPKANRHLVRIFTPENLRKLTKGMLPQI